MNAARGEGPHAPQVPGGRTLKYTLHFELFGVENLMDYGQLYNQRVAATYDEDCLGLLAGARRLAIAQLVASDLAPTATVLDLGVGTGESLCALLPRFPHGRKIGIDLSGKMIEAAQRKLAFEAHVDDACNVGAHVPAGSVDLVLAHFLTSFVSRPRLFSAAATALRPGGLFSVVSTTTEAFLKIRNWIGQFLDDPAGVQAANPSPETGAALAEELRTAGFEILAIETFRQPVIFASFEETIGWGIRSGFFAHSIEAIGLDRLAPIAHLPGIFPFEEEYVGVAILAAPIGSGTALG